MKASPIIHQGNVLTPSMRLWLGAERMDEHALLWDVMQDFMKRFNLTRDQAGRLIAQWINETC